jgi:hypothetical protein
MYPASLRRLPAATESSTPGVSWRHNRELTLYFDDLGTPGRATPTSPVNDLLRLPARQPLRNDMCAPAVEVGREAAPVGSDEVLELEVGDRARVPVDRDGAACEDAVGLELAG